MRFNVICTVTAAIFGQAIALPSDQAAAIAASTCDNHPGQEVCGGVSRWACGVGPNDKAVWLETCYPLESECVEEGPGTRCKPL